MTTMTTTPAGIRTGSTMPLLSPAVVTMSALLAVVAATTSAIGLLSPWAYAAETENWRLQAQGQDLGNVIAVVVLAALPAGCAARVVPCSVAVGRGVSVPRLAEVL